MRMHFAGGAPIVRQTEHPSTQQSQVRRRGRQRKESYSIQQQAQRQQAHGPSQEKLALGDQKSQHPSTKALAKLSTFTVYKDDSTTDNVGADQLLTHFWLPVNLEARQATSTSVSSVTSTKVLTLECVITSSHENINLELTVDLWAEILPWPATSFALGIPDTRGMFPTVNRNADE